MNTQRFCKALLAQMTQIGHTGEINRLEKIILNFERMGLKLENTVI